MALFKSSGMVRFDPARLAGIEALVEEHESLAASLKRASPARRAGAAAPRGTRP
jgi:hypothetical protein